MWEALIELIKSWAYRCDHDWELEKEFSLYSDHNTKGKHPHTIRITYRCTKCCKFKQKEL